MARTDGVDIRDWRDESYAEHFEKQLARNHVKQKSTVSIDGVEFNECSVFIPKDEDKSSHYVLVDEEFIPYSADNIVREEDGSRPHENWLHRWISKTRNSDVYYQDMLTDISTNYISPSIEWEDQVVSYVTHPNHVRRYSRIMVVGEPGAGKTSFARYIAHTYMREHLQRSGLADPPLVFYFQLRDFSRKAHDLDAWLSQEESRVGSKLVRSKHSVGKVLFVFDGLDELNGQDRLNFTGWLSEFLENRPSSSTIVTSRNLRIINEGLWSTFSKAKIRPFDRAQINEYCHLVLGDSELTKKFTGFLDGNSDLAAFLRNPFSLSLALGMYQIRGALPVNIGALCKELVSQLVGMWDARRGIARDSVISIESINATLGKLAYKLQSSQAVQFAEKVFDEFLPLEFERLGSRSILQEIHDRTGIVRELDDRKWAFSHRYFQDFFCASNLVERAGGLGDELSRHGRDNGWVEVWRQVGQLCQDPEFFALSENRGTSDAVKAVDRMVSSLLSHDGLSKIEIQRIVEGLRDEIVLKGSDFPPASNKRYGVELDCEDFDRESIQVLEKVISSIVYLRNTMAGDCVNEYFSKEEWGKGFGRVIGRILSSSGAIETLVDSGRIKVLFTEKI